MPKSIYYDENGNEQVLSSSPSALSGLLDVSVSGATQGQVLTKGVSGWEAKDIITAVTNDDLQTITPTASGVTNYGQGSYYYQKGKLTFVHINIQGLTANSQTTIYTMPTGARPIKNVFACGFCGTSYTGVANVTVTTGGNVQVASVDTYASVYVVYVAS